MIIVLTIYYSMVSLTFPIAYGPVIILVYGIMALLYVFIKKKDISKAQIRGDLYE